MTAIRRARRHVATLPLAAALAGLLAAGLGVGSCAHTPSHLPSGAATTDSATIVLWHMDESGGDRVRDASGSRLDGVAGADTGTEFGRFGNARVFTRSIESFIHLPHHPSLESPLALTVEAWIYVREYGRYEDTPIVCRWTELANEQSWLLGIVGYGTGTGITQIDGPLYHRTLVQLAPVGHLVFAFQPESARPPVTFFSNFPIELERWTHVAVTFDGAVVRMIVDGRLDAQYASGERIRATQAPILVGNYFDPRWLTNFGGTLRVGGSVDRTPYYAFMGSIDELRISSVPRF